MATKLPNRKRLVKNFPRIWDINDLLESIQAHGDRICYKYFEQGKVKEMTYTEVHTMVNQVAAAFDKLGFAGKRVAVIGDTSPQWLCTYMGALASGAVIIPMDKELALPEIEKFLEMVEAEAIVYSKSFNEKFVTTIGSHPTLQRFIPISADYDASFSDKVLPFKNLLEIGQAHIDEGYTIGMVKNRDEMCEMLFKLHQPHGHFGRLHAEIHPHPYRGSLPQRAGLRRLPVERRRHDRRQATLEAEDRRHQPHGVVAGAAGC